MPTVAQTSSTAQVQSASTPASDTSLRSIEISWDDFLDGKFPRPLSWADAVHEAARTVANSPDFIPEAGRLRAGIELALNHAVTCHADGTATVRNGGS